LGIDWARVIYVSSCDILLLIIIVYVELNVNGVNMAARSIKPRHQEEIKTKIQASQLVNLLQNHALGKIEIDQARIQSAKILLDRAIPTLSAVEQTNIDPQESLTEQQLMDRLVALIDAHPDLVQRALAAKARAAGATLGATEDAQNKDVA
jgi:Asp-tRNA(Asn)/Glu-tRNA(Gln) amidotransferase B subunit